MPKTAADLGIVLPIIHMNGDTRETLLANLSNLYSAYVRLTGPCANAAQTAGTSTRCRA